MRWPISGRGFPRLSRLGLSFEAWQFHPQLPEVTDLARAFPETLILLNHVGGPLGIGPYEGKRDEVFKDWRRDIRELAKQPNVWVKLGGLGMAICGFGFHKRDQLPDSDELAKAWRPYIETCIEAFGPQRSMFESNFPVDKVSCSYRTLWNAFKRLAAGASAGEEGAALPRHGAEIYVCHEARAGPSTRRAAGGVRGMGAMRTRMGARGSRSCVDAPTPISAPGV